MTGVKKILEPRGILWRNIGIVRGSGTSIKDLLACKERFIWSSMSDSAKVQPKP